MKKALLVIDFQNDYFAGGKLELAGVEQAAENAAKLIKKFRAEEKDIVHIQHLSTRPGADFLIPGTKGCDINPLVTPVGGEIIVEKNFPNGFRATMLEKILRASGIEELVICGAMTHMCIDATTRAAFDFGFVCTVVDDACATKDLAFDGKTIAAKDVHAAFLAALMIPYAKVLTTQEILNEE